MLPTPEKFDRIRTRKDAKRLRRTVHQSVREIRRALRQGELAVKLNFMMDYEIEAIREKISKYGWTLMPQKHAAWYTIEKLP